MGIEVEVEANLCVYLRQIDVIMLDRSVTGWYETEGSFRFLLWYLVLTLLPSYRGINHYNNRESFKLLIYYRINIYEHLKSYF